MAAPVARCRHLASVDSFRGLVRKELDGVADKLVEQYSHVLAQGALQDEESRIKFAAGLVAQSKQIAGCRGDRGEEPAEGCTSRSQDEAALLAADARPLQLSRTWREGQDAGMAAAQVADECEGKADTPTTVSRIERIIFFTDMSTECDDECALLYILADANQKERPLTIELVMSDSHARFKWMEHLFSEKFSRSNWKKYDTGDGFECGHVRVNFYLAHCPSREGMVIKDFQNKAPDLHLPIKNQTVVWQHGSIGGKDHNDVPPGPAHVILVAAPIMSIRPEFFSRFQDVQCVYVVGTPGGVNCPQNTWGGLLHAMQRLSPVVYLTPQFTRAVRFPKSYAEENPHWTTHIKRTVFDCALTNMARRPEIPAEFGDWGLVLRLNTANMKLCESWYEEVFGRQIPPEEQCPEHLKSIVNAYVQRNSGLDRKPGQVVNELHHLGITSKAKMDSTGSPISDDEREVLRQEYREALFETVYTCVFTAETLLFKNIKNFDDDPGKGNFLTMKPICGYKDPHHSLNEINEANKAIDILKELPLKALTPAYDMVGAICTVYFPQIEKMRDEIGLKYEIADPSLAEALFPEEHRGDMRNHIYVVNEQDPHVITGIVGLLNEQVNHDPWAVLDDFWMTRGSTRPTPRAYRAPSPGDDSRTPTRSLTTARKLSAWARRHGTSELSQPKTLLEQCIVHPTHRSSRCWNVLACLFILHDWVVIPLQVFEVYEHRYVLLVAQIYWTFDLAFQFFIGHYHGGTTEMDPSKIAQRYLKREFSVDLLCVVSIWLLWAPFEATTRFVIRGIQLVRLLRLRRLRFFYSLIGTVSSPRLFFAMQLGGMILIFLAANHVVACLWYFLASINKWSETTWLKEKSLSSEVWDDSLYKYLTCFHWAFAHLILENTEIVPTNRPERIMTICTLLVGLLVFSSFISSITGFTAQVLQQGAENRRRNIQVRQFFEENSISPDLSNQIEHTRRHMRKNTAIANLQFKDVEGLQDIPMELKEKLCGEVFGPAVRMHPLLTQHSIEDKRGFTYLCFKAMDEEHWLPTKDIFAVHQLTKKVHMLVTGSCRYSRTGDAEGEVVHRGSWVSEAALWLKWKHRGYLKTYTTCSIHVINIDKFQAVITESTDFGASAAKFAESVARRVPTLQVPFVLLSDLWHNFDVSWTPPDRPLKSPRSSASGSSQDSPARQLSDGSSLRHLTFLW